MARSIVCGLGLAIVALGFMSPVWAELNVVATTPSLGMLVREVGRDDVKVSVLTTPEQNVHQVQARPSIMAKLRAADLLVAMGADLEVGWIGPAVRGAANPALLPSRKGYFEAAAHVERIGAGKPADRRLGDVHPQGNPHVTIDPVRTGTIAVALALRLGQLDAARADEYARRARDLNVRLVEATEQLRAQVPKGVGVILYHEDANYLMRRLGVPVLGYMEPLPGIPPTASHLARISTAVQGKQGVILHTPYQSASGPRWLATRTKWPVRILPIEPTMDAGASEYLAHIERWVKALKVTGESG